MSGSSEMQKALSCMYDVNKNEWAFCNCIAMSMLHEKPIPMVQFSKCDNCNTSFAEALKYHIQHAADAIAAEEKAISSHEEEEHRMETVGKLAIAVRNTMLHSVSPAFAAEQTHWETKGTLKGKVVDDISSIVNAHYITLTEQKEKVDFLDQFRSSAKRKLTHVQIIDGLANALTKI